MLTELKNRGVDDVLMLVCDGLKGLPDAVETVWPARSCRPVSFTCCATSFRYAARQDWDKIAKALKPVYTAPSEDAATERFVEFAGGLGQEVPGDRQAVGERLGRVRARSCPSTSRSARSSAPRTRSSSVNARIRKAVRARGHFPNEAAALKCVYMALMSLDPTGKGRKRWTMRWKAPLNAFQIAFEGRLTPANN